jgi:hypothetical protein
LQALKLFTSYAKEIDAVEAYELVPDILVFDFWDKCDFKLVETREWKDGKTMHFFVRK